MHTKQKSIHHQKLGCGGWDGVDRLGGGSDETDG